MDFTNGMKILLSALAIIWMIFYSGSYLYRLIKERRISIAPVFHGFGQKMWMTAGIGFLFFSVYLFLVIGGSYLTAPEDRLAIFFMVYSNPISFIYFGLFICICFSLLVYLVRIVIKYICNSRF